MLCTNFVPIILLGTVDMRDKFHLVLVALGIFAACAVAFWYPLYVFGAVAVFLCFVLVKGAIYKRRGTKRGWRVGHRGRDAMYYEEWREGTWHRFEVDGEMLTGRAHHVIYFATTRFPDWASGRREAIIGRIKSEFHPPDYEYVDA
jgi:hypothetical protein